MNRDNIRHIAAFASAMQNAVDSQRCVNCSFWQRDGQMGKCDCSKFFYDCGSGYDDDKRDDGLGYSDFEGYNADFRTGPQFGCVHFNRK